MMFESLFSAHSIGSCDVRNRAVMPAMTTGYASPEGYITDRTREYYRERAKGGPGLIIFESTYPYERHQDRHLLVDDSYIEGLRSVVEIAHEEGVKMAIQLNVHRADADTVDPLAPSEMESPKGKTVPAVTTDRIEAMIAAMADGAERAKQAGFDGIEVHAASGYLLHQFLSPYTNRRDDEYGGSLANRTRFARELLAAMRDRVGESFPVWFRIPGDEFVDGGLNVEEAAAIAGRLEAAGSDAFHVTAGHSWNSQHVVVTGAKERGTYATLASRVREAVDVPVISVGRISDPEVANDIIAGGKADFAAMGRAHIADPHIIRKAKEGNTDAIRHCVGGLEGCWDRWEGGVACTVNADVGREGTVDRTMADTPKTVAVVGGGPAGLEAARNAAQRGHNVTVYERADEIGGQLRVAKNAPSKQEYAELQRYFRTELHRHDVAIECGRDVTPDDIDDLDVDAVVIATGSAPSVPSIEGMNAAIARGDIVTPADVLDESPTGTAVDADTAVILGGDNAACDVAESLATGGIETIVLADDLLPRRSSETAESAGTREVILGRLRSHKALRLVDGVSVREIDENAVTATVDGRETAYPYDCLVLAGEREPYNELRSTAPEVTVIGDADGPVDLYEAIHDGAAVGRSL